MGNPGKVIIPTQVVQSSFKKVFMEDLAVLGMFILLVAICAMTWSSASTVEMIDGPAKNQTQICGTNKVNESYGKWFGEAFFPLAALWSFMYMKCSCCANKVSVTKEEMAKKFPDEYGHL